MTNRSLFKLEDVGMAHLLNLKDLIDTVTQDHAPDSQEHIADNVSHELPSNPQVDVQVQPTIQSLQPVTHDTDTVRSRVRKLCSKNPHPLHSLHLGYL